MRLAKWTHSFKIQFAACFCVPSFSFHGISRAVFLLFDKTSIDKLPALIMQLNWQAKDDIAQHSSVFLASQCYARDVMKKVKI